ncbi:hypothetical protein BK726_00895 [Bacillus thuringiensis serovar londrina]|uniref:Uncharacterized protein n=2 Tax=Bacillus thuringiensis TaxID=1428 RepID=A0A1B2RC80_BACTU|nr:hypothetical protein [Bacillus thuringiensis]AOB42262.1 hypothetical protein pFR260_165c [Bacillus thuringiensis]OMH24242.1 hypothetical protein BUM91_30670 [Bacillus thuringiensis]OTX88769.1 hypothetical protein BK726_14325 [Bacillus thuringiensis serovar londrina]OTX91813.1 hypothetical protein BK726_09735 [Bacillus thuringiensis serovar londrina]OTX97842.1 hypothetical protein BK726_00895 [Bacillus thuringiensis serovar londrina]
MKQENENGYEIEVEQIETKIECESCCISPGEHTGISGGVALTGFIDVEKIITVKNNGCKEKLFLEKKLPFQIVILNLGKQTDNEQVKPKYSS